MNTIRSPQHIDLVETLVDSLCTRVLYGGLHSTLLESPSEERASKAVKLLRDSNHNAYYRFHEKRGEWHVTIKH